MTIHDFLKGGLAALMMMLPAMGQGMHPWDVATVPQPGQETAYMAIPGGGFCGLPVEMGDYNGDGFPDYAAAQFIVDSGPLHNRTKAGEVTVFKGTGTVSGIINLQSPPPGQPLLRVYGGHAFDFIGTELFSADVTGDGFADLIMGAMGASPNGRNTAGAVYIIKGGPGFSGVIDLAVPPSSVIFIKGRNPGDRLGIWVEAGDINGDGVDDILMGADGGDGINNAHNNRGEVVVIFGGSGLPSQIDLANPPLGVNVTTVYGVDNFDHLGTCLHSRDLDGDGFEELVASAAINRAGAAQTGVAVAGGDGPNNNRSQAGESYVIWGRAQWPVSINLASPDPVTGASLTIIYGADSGDVLGEELTSGNFDGDAYNDLGIGALTAQGQNNALFVAGDAVVIYGGPQMRGQVFDMALLPPGTVTIHGQAAGDITADTLTGADINKDGFDDFLVAAPERDPIKPLVGSVHDAGAVDVLFGGPVRWPVEMVLGSLGTTIPKREVWGAEANDLLGYSMESGDFDGDGFEEIFPNAMRGDGFNNSAGNAGEVNIVSGQPFCRGLVTLNNAPSLGSIVGLNMVGEPGASYVAAFSLALGPGIPVAGVGTVNLAPDFLFLLSLNPAIPFFGNMAGQLNGQGQGQFNVSLPNLPALIGTEIFTAFVTLNQQATAVLTISDSLSFIIQP